jgi:hypothetical protein
MRCSYCWNVTPRELVEGRQPCFGPGTWEGSYVRLHCVPTSDTAHNYEDAETVYLEVLEPPEDDPWILVKLPKSAMPQPAWEAIIAGRIVFENRLGFGSDELIVDATRGRFHAASIAGLVVGAMGAFVFTVALKHWLGERRAHAASAEDAPPGSPLRPE